MIDNRIVLFEGDEKNWDKQIQVQSDNLRFRISEVALSKSAIKRWFG